MNSTIDLISAALLFATFYMTVWWFIGLALRRRDVVDTAWGLGFILVAVVSYILGNNSSLIAQLSLGLVIAWGLRLAAHITLRNWKKKEDQRYADLGDLSTLDRWLVTFVKVFLLQGVLMVIISLPVIAIMQATSEPLMPLAVGGLALWLFGGIFEAVGDFQLRQFIRSGKKGIMKTGLWAYTRHPNYFGEVTVWWGAALVALSYGAWIGILGALTITILITKVSGIPLLEKKYADNPEFQAYAKKVPIFIPRLTKHA